MRYPPSFIEEIRNAANIETVVGARVPLKRAGRSLTACCPFHKEKTPSFHVNTERNRYHCFGCGVDGDAIKFIQEFEGRTFAEALEHLAGELGIPIPELQDVEAEQKAASLYDVMEATCAWFEQQRLRPTGRAAHTYLTDRGFADTTITHFRLGYAPNTRHNLKDHLLKEGFKEADLIEAGLIIKPNEGTSYDRFRNRVMFPIHDPKGRVIAFGGRILGDGQPKYLNSPETPLFHKSRTLYNLHNARRAAHDAGGNITIVEGYTDVIAMTQAGITNAVAPLGTAVTEQHLQLLWRMAKEPTFCLDGDTAGLKAMERASDLALPLLKPGYSLRFCLLPEGEDPDTFLRHKGTNALETLLKNASTLSHMLWRSHSTRNTTNTPERMAALEADLMRCCNTIQDSSVQTYYRDFFKQKLWEQRRTLPKQSKPGTSATINKPRSPKVERLAQLASPGTERRERIMLALILKYPQLLETHEETFGMLTFENPDHTTLQRAIMEAYANNETETGETLKAYLAQQNLTTISTHITTASEIKLARFNAPDATLDDALTAWHKCLRSFESEQRRQFFREQSRKLGENTSEESWNRLKELHIPAEAE